MSATLHSGLASGLCGTIALRDDVLPSIIVLSVDMVLHATAQSRCRASLPSTASFVDQVSSAVMAEASIGTAIALDAAFMAAGVSVVPAT